MIAEYALFGYPVGHSVSPAMQQAAFDSLGIAARYTAVSVLPGDLPQTIASLRAGRWQGANLTVPHKQNVLPLLDGLTSTAQLVGAVNTLYWDNGLLVGDNTDVGGFLADLFPIAPELPGQAALVFGTGGAARAVVAALLNLGVLVRLMGRNRAAAEHLAAELTDAMGQGAISVHDFTPLEIGAQAENCALAVNCTTLGMLPERYTSPWPAVVPVPTHLLVYDLVYNPPETALMQHARAHHAQAVNGLGMLVNQGALAFTHWTGHSPNLARMRAAAEAALPKETD